MNCNGHKAGSHRGNFSPHITGTDANPQNSVTPQLLQTLHPLHSVERQGMDYSINHTSTRADMCSAGLSPTTRPQSQPPPPYGPHLMEGCYACNRETVQKDGRGGIPQGCPCCSAYERRLGVLEGKFLELFGYLGRHFTELKTSIKRIGQKVDGTMEYCCELKDRMKYVEDAVSVAYEHKGDSGLHMSEEMSETDFQTDDRRNNFNEVDELTDSAASIGLSSLSNGIGQTSISVDSGLVFVPEFSNEDNSLANSWATSERNTSMNSTATTQGLKPQGIRQIESGNSPSGGPDKVVTSNDFQGIMNGNKYSGKPKWSLSEFGNGNPVIAAISGSRNMNTISGSQSEFGKIIEPGKLGNVQSPISRDKAIHEPLPTVPRTSQVVAGKIKKERVAHFAVSGPRSECHKCNCGLEYQSWHALITHVKTKGCVEPRWRCIFQHCDRRFPYPFMVRHHLAKVHKQHVQRLGSCPKCYKLFPEKLGMTSHLNERNQICESAPKRRSARPSANQGTSAACGEKQPSDIVTLN